MVNNSTIILIDSLKKKINVTRICEILSISRETYYYSKNNLINNELTDLESELQQTCIKTKFLYGYRKIHDNTKLAIDTLNQLDNIEGAILHSDQCSTYTSFDYFELSRKKGVIRSMSRKGMSADNAIIESFHSSLKSEMIYTKDNPMGFIEYDYLL